MVRTGIFISLRLCAGPLVTHSVDLEHRFTSPYPRKQPASCQFRFFMWASGSFGRCRSSDLRSRHCPRRDFDTAHIVHDDVEEGEIGTELLDSGNAIRPARRFSNEFQFIAGRFDELGQPGSEQGVIVDKQNAPDDGEGTCPARRRRLGR